MTFHTYVINLSWYHECLICGMQHIQTQPLAIILSHSLIQFLHHNLGYIDIRYLKALQAKLSKLDLLLLQM